METTERWSQERKSAVSDLRAGALSSEDGQKGLGVLREKKKYS